MKIGNRWSAKLEELSSGHYHCRAVDRDGRVLECEGSDAVYVENQIRVDAYLYDNMVLNKALLNSLQGRAAPQALAVFLNGYNALDDSDAGWYAFLASLTTLKGMHSALTPEEFCAVEELSESLVSVFPLLLHEATNQKGRTGRCS